MFLISCMSLQFYYFWILQLALLKIV